MSKRKLLLADDSITIQKVVNLTFADEGIEVISVGDGDAAMRKFDEFMPDLVMADVNMPGIDGYEVCRIIKRTEETQNIPVILLVGSFEPFDEDRAKEAGADDFLTKPFQSIRQLVNKVTDLLNQRAPAETAVAAPSTATAPGVDRFAETLEFEKQEPAAPEFGDAGMDDEMIETSPAVDYGSAPSSDDQTETPVDYAKTQPLNAADLRDLDIGRSDVAAPEPEVPAEPAFEESAVETTGELPGRAEPASFDEEARKLGENYDAPLTGENEERLSETEPQLDYYLPESGAEDEAPRAETFTEEVSDAETLEPEVSYAPEEPREAYFSQTPAEETPEIAAEEAAGYREPVEEPAAEPVAAVAEFEEPAEPEEPSSAAEEYQTGDDGETEPAEEPAGEPEETLETAEYPIAEFEETVETTGEAEETAEFEASEETAETGVSEEAAETEVAEEEEPAETGPVAETETETTPEFDETPEAEPVAEPIYTAPASVPALNFDDGDLLELPPLVEETGIRPQPQVQPVVPEPVAATPAATESSEIEAFETDPAVSPVETVETAAAQSFPPELIDAIAQKVAEQISAKTISDVLPQITELVIKKLAEEKKE